MKYKILIFINIVLVSMLLLSCDDQIMEWEKDPAHGEITEKELPLPIDQQILKYEPLNVYTDFTLGIGIGLGLYMEDSIYRTITNENFDEVTVGYAMKHAVMVNSKGELDFEDVDTFITMAKEAGLSVFGHTLIWHTNQNAGFLNSIIAPVGSMVENGNFESGTIDGWTGWGDNNPTREVSAKGDGYGGTGYAMLMVNPVATDRWKAQTAYVLNLPLEIGEEYTVMFKAKASIDSADLQLEIQAEDYNADYFDVLKIGTSWTKYTQYITPTKDNRTRLLFDFGLTACTLYIDEVVFVKGKLDPSAEVTTVERSGTEKTEIIGDAMESWISQMVGHYKNDVKAWDVVNEPMKEDGTLRDGEVAAPASDEFYWVKYLGKDYAVTAFKLARQYGNATDILFINDYNLEYSLEKCDGLIDYVEYIESKGATVDGIGTQMHLSLNSDSAKIVQMFQKLAATGKLIKISEMDVRLGTASPTDEQLEAQQNMYKYVLDMYMQYIPEAQRYGVTIWGISDNEQEHEFWLPDESPNLWDKEYQRKRAYKGVADGLAGYEVSKDFSGELEY